MTSANDPLSPLLLTAPDELDPLDPGQQEEVQAAADGLIASGLAARELFALEKELCARDEVPLFVHLALKLARSKRLVLDLEQPLFLSVVFAVYKEHNRILPRTEHPAGEDFLFAKLRQLRWLTGEQPGADFELIVVDDGCPEGSGRIALDRLLAHPEETGARVLFLRDAIEQGLPVTAPLKSTDESRKGGSILFGMWSALEEARDGHVVVMTDADLSTHLGQCGLLAHPILSGCKNAAIGSRREANSVVIKQGTRNTRGKLFIYLWKQLLPELHRLVDTQCGFKAFRAESLGEIISETLEKQFAFDIELLLKTELAAPDSIEKVGITWIDSEAESTTTDIQPYLPMLKMVVQMMREYGSPTERAREFGAFIEGLTEEAWQELVTRIPAAIAEADPAGFEADGPVQVKDLK